MKLNQKLKLYLLWNNYVPADEREYLVYHKGWKQSYITMLAITGTIPLLTNYIQSNAPHLNLTNYLDWFWVVTIFFSQFAGGYAMRHDDLSLNKFRFFANREASSFILIAGAIVVGAQFFLIPLLNNLY